MNRPIKEETKIARGYGTGEGKDYKPWILTREFNSKGTCSNPKDWKTGRTMQLLSQGEEYAYYYLRWQDAVKDYREQFPLDLEITVAIADALGYRHPKNRQTHMTTDVFLTLTDDSKVAISIKDSRKDLENSRTLEKLTIEKMYWQYQNIPWKILYKEDIPKNLVMNVRLASVYYDENSVFDPVSLAKHLAIHKTLPNIDFTKQIFWPEVVIQDPHIKEVFENGRPYHY